MEDKVGENLSDDQLLERPIVILGAPRSGTTVLSQLLKSHPKLYLANEPRILWKFGNDGKSDVLQPKDARREVVSHIRGQLAGQVRAAGRSRLVEKTPSNSLRVRFVNEVLPDALFIHILREGVESVLSIRKYSTDHSTGLDGNKRTVLWRRLAEMNPRQYPHYAKEFGTRVLGKMLPGSKRAAVWGPRIPGIREMVRDLDPIEVAAWQWRMCVERACIEGRALPAGRYTECRLEEFDESVFRRLLKFCNLDACEEVMSTFSEMFDAREPQARSQAAESDELARVRELVEPTDQWLKSLELVCHH